MRQQWVMGNWKMNGNHQEIKSLVQGMLVDIPPTLNCAIFPAFPYLSYAGELIQNSSLHMGAQNVYPQASGAYTGEVSGPMLKDTGCRFVLVGHSERRQLFKENEKIVAEKFHHVKEHGMIPVLCVGETQKEREDGLTEDVLLAQINSILEEAPRAFSQSIIAYEPVWAIGTGKTASPEQAQETHAFIRSIVAKASEQDAGALPILYGGSVNENNASALFAKPDIDGGLVGGASLNAQKFVEIIKCIN